jgi:hypothetical protein
VFLFFQGWVTPPLHRLNQPSSPPHPHKEKVKFSLHLLGHQLCPGGMQFAYKLRWTVISSRADGATHSSGKVATSLGVIGGWSKLAQAGICQRCFVHEFWCVQDNLSAYKTHSMFSILSFCSLERGKNEGENKRRNGYSVGQSSSCSIWVSGAVTCYKKLI